MHPLRCSFPLALTVFHVTNKGYSSSFTEGPRIKESRDDRDDAEDDLEVLLSTVWLEVADEGVDDDEALAGEAA